MGLKRTRGCLASGGARTVATVPRMLSGSEPASSWPPKHQLLVSPDLLLNRTIFRRPAGTLSCCFKRAFSVGTGHRGCGSRSSASCRSLLQFQLLDHPTPPSFYHHRVTERTRSLGCSTHTANPSSGIFGNLDLFSRTLKSDLVLPGRLKTLGHLSGSVVSTKCRSGNPQAPLQSG